MELAEKLTDIQKDLVALLESNLQDQIDGIGDPELDENENIVIIFQYGEDTYTATIDPDKEQIQY